MAYYKSDRAFTDYVHSRLALPNIYQRIGYIPFDLPPRLSQTLDITNGIDYSFRTQKGEFITIQERFRASRYSSYNDITFRYRRDNNPFSDRRESEFYKIKATHFLYGITNGNKNDFQKSVTGFHKFCLFKVQPILQKMEAGEVLISNKIKRSIINEKRLIVPHIQNHDGSSSFIAFDVKMMNELWADEVIVFQKGFF